MHEGFRVRPADHPDSPAPPERAANALGGVELVATHETWLLGVQFPTLSYGIGRNDG